MVSKNLSKITEDYPGLTSAEELFSIAAEAALEAMALISGETIKIQNGINKNPKLNTSQNLMLIIKYRIIGFFFELIFMHQ
jgi:hypothetical protein